MTPQRLIGTALASAAIAGVTACGAGDTSVESTDTTAFVTNASTIPEADVGGFVDETPPVGSQPVTESTAVPPTNEPVAPPPSSADVGTTEPPTTRSATRQPAPPLVGTTDLLVDGVKPLPDVGFRPGTSTEPGRYHSYRLGTEIVFDLPEPFGVGWHQAGAIGWDLGEPPIIFARWHDEALGPDAWVDELLNSTWDVVEGDWPDISGYAVRRFDVTPASGQEMIGGVEASGALWFGDGRPRRIWIIDQDDGQPIVIATDATDAAWRDVADDLVAAIEVGPTRPDPRNGRAPIEYGEFLWEVAAGDHYRTLLFGGAVVAFPDDTSGYGSNLLSVVVPGEFSGTERPVVSIGTIGRLVLPPSAEPDADDADRVGARPADAAAVRDHLVALADMALISPLRALDTTATLLGRPTTAWELDVPSGAEVYPAVAEPDGWSHLNLVTLGPGRTYRVWIADVDDQVAIVLASADAGNTADLDLATDHAENVVMASFRAD